MKARLMKWLCMLLPVLGMALCSGVSAGERYWEGWWLPEGVCSYDNEIDSLFYGILILTTAVFVLTEAVLLVFIIKYRRKEGQKSYYTHGNHLIEMIWTVTPALILIFIALYQAKTWNTIKDYSAFKDKEDDPRTVKVQLMGKQFSWFFRYPNDKGKFGEAGGFTTERDLYIPVNRPIVIEQTSIDVIHSFFLPYMRLKQDLVPGMQIKVWFDASKTTEQMRDPEKFGLEGRARPKMTMLDPKMIRKEREWNYPIVCAELCGIQHYQMWGRVFVVTDAEYDAWLKKNRDEGLDEADIFAKFWKVDPKTGGRIYGEEDGNIRTKLPTPYAVAHPEVLHEEGGAGHAEKAGEKHEEKKADEKKPDEKKPDEKK